MPAIQCYALKYHRWRTTSCVDPSCSSSRGAFSFCSFVQIKLSFHRVQLFIRTSVSTQKLLWCAVSGLDDCTMPKLVISEVPSGSVAAIPASFVRLVTTYLINISRTGLFPWHTSSINPLRLRCSSHSDFYRSPSISIP